MRNSRALIIIIIWGFAMFSPLVPQIARRASSSEAPRTWIVDDDGPADFHTIPEAINAASDGDTVFVRNGTYYGNVVVNKTLSLVGEDAENTIIDGSGVGSVLTIVTAYASVTGFTMRNGGAYPDAGIYLEFASHCNITGNNITNNYYGIGLVYSSNNSISGNNITANNNDGIYLYLSSSYNSISGNGIAANNGAGVRCLSSNNSISGNSIAANHWEGIYLYLSSSYNSISGNDIAANNREGIYLYLSSSYNSISGNNITANNNHGIYLDFTSNYNSVSGNNIANNNVGVWLYSSNNTFFHNNFVNNTVQATEYDSANAWDDGYPSGGNYWSDYNGTDANGDGIGDAPYIIDVNNQDRYPLVHPYDSIVNLNTSLTYLTIQSAINAPQTLNGHTVLVRPGTYNERVIVNKTLSIIGSGSESTVISGSSFDSAVGMAADNVDLGGFTICGSDFGLKVYSHNNNIHDNNIVENGFIGIYLYLSSGNTFTSNNVSRNGYGVSLVHSGGNTFKQNSIFDNEWQELVVEGNTASNFVEDMDTSNAVDGKPVYYWVDQQDKTVPSDAGYVALVDCRRILVQNLTFTRNGQGVLLAGTTDSTIESNTLSAESYGVYMVDSSNVTIRNCTIAGCNFAMEIWYSSGNNIIGNNIVSNAYGIELAWSNYNNISRNTITQTSEYNGWGICLSVSATGNQIYENDFAHNSQGMNIQLFYPGENKIYHNNFMQNAIQVYYYESAGNVWDDGYPSAGNYWSDYNGSDLYLGEFQTEPGGDGIGDSAYTIDPNNRDNYPLMEPWTAPDVAVPSVSSSKSIVGEGYATNVTLIVENQGNKIETLNTTVRANDTLLNVQTFLVRSNNSLYYSFVWDTSGLVKGNYTLSVTVEPIEGEADLADNLIYGNRVLVTIPGDVNGDGAVDNYDLKIVANAFGSQAGDPAFSPNADIKEDGTIGIYDLILVASHYGEHYP